MFLPTVMLLVLAVGPAVHPSTAGLVPSGIWLNASETDLWSPTEEPPFQGDRTLYLWEYNWDMNRITFGLEGTLEVVDVIPEPGWVNIGTVQSPNLFQTGGCARGGLVVARVIVRDETGSGGRLCFVESAIDSRICFDYCTDEWWRLYETPGYITDGGAKCPWIYSPECSPLAVTPSTWGGVKATYR